VRDGLKAFVQKPCRRGNILSRIRKVVHEKTPEENMAFLKRGCFIDCEK
jgi:hypothetical protein